MRNFDRYYDPPEDPDDAPVQVYDGIDGEPDSVWDFGTRQDAAFNATPMPEHPESIDMYRAMPDGTEVYDEYAAHGIARPD
jgi:hypothetical protein